MAKKPVSTDDLFQELSADIRKNGETLESVTWLLQNLLAIQLWRGGVSQKEIGKRLGVATARVNKILKSVKREITTNTLETE